MRIEPEVRGKKQTPALLTDMADALATVTSQLLTVSHNEAHLLRVIAHMEHRLTDVEAALETANHSARVAHQLEIAERWTPRKDMP